MSEKYYFKVRVTNPPGIWVLGGEYRTYDAAKAARNRAKAPDLDVTTVFSAKSKQEAESYPAI